MTEPPVPARRPRPDLAVAALAAFTFVFHLTTAPGYGIFRDELYYLACGEHLGFGYIDHPPLVGLLAAFARALFGTSLYGLRLLPALAAAATVGLTAALARTLGGGRYAAILAGLAALLAPVYLALFTILSMNAFDVLFWALAAWIVARRLAGGDPRLWLAFGAVAGLALENKISFLFCGFGIAAGLLLARRWEQLRGPHLWLGGLLAGLLAAPYAVWQHVHGWPLLEFMDNARRLKNVALPAGDFLAQQALQMGPLALPLWLAGLGWLLAAPRARPFRALGWAYLAVLAAMLALGDAKPYYLSPAYIPLFAAGAVALAGATAGRRFGFALRAAAAVLLVAGGALAAPLAKPLLPVETYVRYQARLGISGAAEERHELGRLPQFFADMHGWRELAETVAGVWAKLPAEDRSRACIFGQNYGQAGAIDFFGPAFGLPKAISAHNSYWVWGPRGCTGEVVLVLGDDRERLEELFATVEPGAVHHCTDCMPYEDDRTVWIARGLKPGMGDLWAEIKRFI